MDPKNKKYCGFVSSEQKKELILFMEEHPELKSGKFTQDFSFKTAQALWIKLAGRLHSLPGAHKDWKQWRKTWQDLKSKSKKKKTEIRNHQMGTGGGPAVADLNSYDEKILELIGPVLVDGDRNVEESSCHFTVSSLNESTFNVEPITFSPESNHPLK
ncbi:uncharacterized protein LOC126745999 [Anthonomus grandis grandis]|uniref:uncharacterized protein LOC126745999 n=1 Tax=Anthonomus grandis grandis TaxID=2921223 RepID=UPI0021662E9C|nr:uncharacterized protein LOC126745999 [Anthonomus grandis grandis]